MAYDTLKLIALGARFAVPLMVQLFLDNINAIIHRFTYRETTDAQNVVVIGGSFAGIEMARRLMYSLPTGYRVVLIERNSHFNYTFNFPRYSVLKGHERLAFIPYDGLAKNAPRGVFRHLRGEASSLTKDAVTLKDGSTVPYAFVVIATGTTQRPPTKVESTDRDEACDELQQIQRKIEAATKIAIVGGGAVGVELATDIKSYHPSKDVTLVHSREQLLPRFGTRLHRHVLAALQAMEIKVILNERPQVSSAEPLSASSRPKQSLKFADDNAVEYDLIVPNAAMIKDLLPCAISKHTDCILVQPTLQVHAQGLENETTNIFAIGDIAESGSPKMARSAFYQVSTVQKNILSQLRGRPAATIYKPQPSIEGALKLTLGKTDHVIYCQSDDGDEILVTSRGGKDDLDVKSFWKRYGADLSSIVPRM